MNPLPGTIRGAGDPFVSTQWSVILAASASEAPPASADAALEQLCQTYWPPLYTFVRHRGCLRPEAEDLTQSFFAFLIEHRVYARAERGKGKFRSFLLASLKNFLNDAYDRAQSQKRGGGHVLLPLNEEQIEEVEAALQSEPAHGETTDEDRAFERSWAESLVAAAFENLSSKYAAEGRTQLFGDLKVFLTGSADPLPTYEDLSAKLGTPAATLRSDVTRLRARYRAVLRAEVRRTVDSDAAVEDELRELLRVLTHRS